MEGVHLYKRREKVWKQAHSCRGIALLLVIWVVAALTLIALALSIITRSEAFSAHRFCETAANRCLAEAGVEKAFAELSYRLMHRVERSAWKADGSSYVFELGGGRCRVSVSDEAGKLNLNTMTDKNKIILKNILVTVAGVAPDAANVIADSVLDWKEPDNLRRTYGTDDEYYLSLPDPYKPRHAPFESLDELLLVRGMNADILYGNTERKGILPFITIYSQAEKINVMTAPREVLAAVPGLSSDIIDKFISLRGKEPVDGEAGKIISSALAPEPAQFAYAGESGNAVRIQSTGYSSNEKTGFRIDTVVTAFGTGKPKMLYYKAPAYSR